MQEKRSCASCKRATLYPWLCGSRSSGSQPYSSEGSTGGEQEVASGGGTGFAWSGWSADEWRNALSQLCRYIHLWLSALLSALMWLPESPQVSVKQAVVSISHFLVSSHNLGKKACFAVNSMFFLWERWCFTQKKSALSQWCCKACQGDGTSSFCMAVLPGATRLCSRLLCRFHMQSSLKILLHSPSDSTP